MRSLTVQIVRKSIERSQGPTNILAEQTALTERCSQLIRTPFAENSSQVESNRLDQYLKDISSSRRHPEGHARIVEALAMLVIKIPAEFKQVVTVLSMSGPYETIQVANIENCFLVSQRFLLLSRSILMIRLRRKSGF
jgi:hypothetical protein